MPKGVGYGKNVVTKVKPKSAPSIGGLIKKAKSASGGSKAQGRSVAKLMPKVSASKQGKKAIKSRRGK